MNQWPHGRVRGRVAAVVLTALALVSGARAQAADHFPFGLLSAPRTIPAWKVTKSDGTATELSRLLRGHVTALQLMFTSCSATCPLQGATFAHAQAQLGQELPGVQFLSLSIDPTNDSPVAMAEWLKTFGARPGWIGVAPRGSDVSEIVRVLGEGGMPQPQGADPHSGQVYIINRDGVLVYRTAAMPSARTVIDALRTVARQ